MVYITVISVALLIAAVSRKIFGAWFNHVSLYTAIWCGAMVLFEVRMINYPVLSYETWTVIVACWLLFVLGAVTVAFARWTAGREADRPNAEEPPRSFEGEMKSVKTALWILNILTFAAAVHDLYIVSRLFGGLGKAFVLGNLLYSYRISEGLPGSIPYVSSLVFTAALLAGSYTKRLGRLTIAAILPAVIIIMIDFANMGRVDILIVSILFASAYFLTQKRQAEREKQDGRRFRKIAMVIVLAAILIGGADFIRSTRGSNEGLRGSSGTLKKLNMASVITPSVYLYLSSDYAVLNQYLHYDWESTPWGGHTFLPVYRILERLGLDVHASTFQKYYRTPVWTNTGTYLRELHGDFGIAGLLLGPYLLGLLASIFWFRVKARRSYVDLAVAGFLFGIIGMSFFVMPTRISPYFFFFGVSIIVGAVLDRKVNRTSFDIHGHAR
ncbi:MAG: O-antigen polymerase [Acidobacteriota bacterium]